MPPLSLTEQLRVRKQTELEQILTRLLTAKQQGNQASMQQLRAQLDAFRGSTNDSDLQEQATKAFEASILSSLDTAMNDLAAVADKLSGAGAQFKQAAQIAQTGKKELLVPRLAATAASSLEILTVLQTTFDNLEAPGGLGDLKTIVNNATTALRQVKEQAEAIQDTWT